MQGHFTKGREMMKARRTELQKEIKRFENKHKKLKVIPGADIKLVKELKAKVPIYSLSKTVPAKYQGIVVNGQLLIRFIKRLKGFRYEIEVKNGRLYLYYGERRNQWTGTLTLYDLSKYFEGYTDIPKLVIKP